MLRKFFSFFLAFILILQSTLVVVGAEQATGVSADKKAVANTSADQEDKDYHSYFGKWNASKAPIANITAKAENIVSGKYNFNTYDGRKAALIEPGNSVDLNLQIYESGIYNISFDYYNLAGNTSDYVVSLYVDGQLPYTDAEVLSLKGVYKDKLLEDGSLEKDENGNDIRPSQIAIEQWVKGSPYDARGLYVNPYFVYLEAGKHTIKIAPVRNTLAFGAISFVNQEEAIDYATYVSQYSKIYDGDPIVIQAENAYSKSSTMLYPTYDKINAATQPSNSKAIVLNTIGQGNWSNNSDYISWKPDIKEAALYKVYFKARQNYNQGMYSYRTLKINGVVPFKEAEAMGFKYHSEWYIKTLGDEEAYLLYLEPGDEISLTVTPGVVGQVLREVNDTLLDLNQVYRDVIGITSTSPDIYRDYMLSKQLPELEKELAALADRFEESSNKFKDITGAEGSSASLLDSVVILLREFAEDCNYIPERIGSFQGALENVGSVLTSVGSQPLELDYISFAAPDSKAPKADCGWFEQTWFSINNFFASFSDDYNTIGKTEKGQKPLRIWAAVGRDQAKIITSLIRGKFTKETGIPVEFNQVSAGIVQAILAGKDPDIVLNAGVPLELAARGALIELSQYGLDELKDNYNPTFWNAMSHQGGVYGLPTAMTFDIQFYRTDIFEEYGLEVPETWEDFYQVMEIFQKNNLVVGIPETNSLNLGVSDGIRAYTYLLLQNNGKFYNDDLTKVEFNTEPAFKAFETWVDLYKKYGNSREFSFYSRFRTGEMPLGIQPYSVYNQIASAAPEIKGLWDIARIPGTTQADGSVSHAQNAIIAGCIMPRGALKRGKDQQAITFMKWWVSTETQSSYGNELEATLGVAARHTTANKNALVNYNWTNKESEVLLAAVDDIQVLPQVLGNYLIDRSLTTAFRSAVTGKNRSRRALTIATKSINDELKRKRVEFGLDKEEE